MGKRDRIMKSAAAIAVVNGGKKTEPRYMSASSMLDTRSLEERNAQIPLKIGDYQFRIFTDIFDDPKRNEYPAYDTIPEQYKNRYCKEYKIASEMFFAGWRPHEYTYRVPQGIDDRLFKRSVINTISALLRSWEPSQETKMATVAWCIAEWMIID